MAWIPTIPEEQAQGRLAEIYAEIRQHPHLMGLVPNVMKALSTRPELLEAVVKVATTATFGGSRLSRTQEELIAAVVSSVNRCHYCANAHAELLRFESHGDGGLVAQVKRDWRTAPLAEGDRAMLAFAEKLTVNSSAMTRADIDELGGHFNAEQVFDIAVITAMFNFMNRIADAFGVELDSVLAQMARSAPEGEALAELAARAGG
jgi:uncharacterized peroxidase-related enzyme